LGALAYAGPAAYWSGVPAVVHTEHGKHYSSRWKTKMLGRVASRFTQRICCVSEDILQEVIREGIAPATKCSFVPNGIDTSRFSQVPNAVATRRTCAGIPAAALVVGTVGRLTEVKRQSSLIRGFAALLSQLPTIPFHLLVVGDGPERANLESLTDELGIRNRVTFSGYQPQPENYLGLMDIFVLTSRSEGMPLAVLEAWAAGLPVVATRVGGLPQLIQHGITGLLVEFDNISELTTSLGQLASNRDLACRLGTAGKQVVSEHYDVQRMWDKYQAIYQQLMSANATNSCAS
jgi:glycosyltransferase involved in cell wall biosynthesis